MAPKSITKLRQKIVIPAMGAVEVVIGPREHRPPAAYFVCISCERALLWNTDRKWFECPECGYELTCPEALAMCQQYSDELEILRVLAGEKYGRWKRFWLRVKGAFK